VSYAFTALRTYFGTLCCVLALCFVTTAALAEQKKIFIGNDGHEYEVHYIAFNSTFLQPEVARQYGLTRSRARGLVNISVLKVLENGSTEAVGALVDINAKNEIQQVQHMDFQQVVEGKAIYYIGQVQYREAEILTFNATIYPQGVNEPFRLRFTHSFFND